MPQRQDVADLIDRAQTALTNATTDPDLGPPLADYGYDADRLAEGQALLDALEAASAARQREFGEQLGSTEAAGQSFVAARTLYLRHVRLARIVFAGDTGRSAVLRLSGTRAHARAALLDQARTFYTNLLGDAEALAALTEVNVDAEAVEGGLAAVRAAEAARAAQRKETGEAQEATAHRDAAFEALRTWFGRFVEVAKLATEGQPQLRERLGVLERS